MNPSDDVLHCAYPGPKCQPWLARGDMRNALGVDSATGDGHRIGLSSSPVQRCITSWESYGPPESCVACFSSVWRGVRAANNETHGYPVETLERSQSCLGE